jgi:Protein of unknown function (DUF2844)
VIVNRSSRTVGIAAARMAAACALATPIAPAWAVLGGDLASIEADRLQMRATRQAAGANLNGAVQETRMPDGSSIRQYVNAQGIVYAVAWSTRIKPNFAQILGQHAAAFDAGVASAARQPGLKRNVTVDQGDVVVVSSGRPGAFVGRAWLKSQLPVGASVDAIR